MFKKQVACKNCKGVWPMSSCNTWSSEELTQLL